MSIQINFQAPNSPAILQGTPDGFTPGNSLAGEPLGYNGANSEPIDDGSDLPKLKTQPSDSLEETAPFTEVKINNVDHSESLASLDWAQLLNGASQGVLTFRTDRFSKVKVGQVVNVKHRWDGGEAQVLRAFVLEPPKRSGFSPTSTWTVRIGDVFTWASLKRPDADLYCGGNPNSAGSAALLYASLRNLREPSGSLPVFPAGSNLPSGDFYRPDLGFWEFVSGLYSPLGYDVGTDNVGAIKLTLRPESAETGVPISRYFDLDRDYTALNVYSKINVKSDYTVDLGYTREEVITTKILNPNVTDKPWFLGGRMEIITKRVKFGSSDIFVEETTRGLIPDELTGAIPDLENPCEILDEDEMELTEGIIETKTFALTYEDVGAGAYLITGWREFTTGLQAKTENNQYTITEGPINERTEQYTNKPQPVMGVCERDYIYLRVKKVTAEYEPETHGDSLRFIKGDVETFTVRVEGPVDGAGYSGPTKSWRREFISSALDETTNSIFTQPPINDESSPPISAWVKSKTQTYSTRATVELTKIKNEFGNAVAPDISSTSCFTVEDAERLGRRWLAEQAGLHSGVSVVAPYWTPANVGSVVKIENKLGLVYASELNQSAGVVTKTFTIMMLGYI